MKKKILCTLLTMTLCLAQVLSVCAEGLSADGMAPMGALFDDAEEIAEADAEELPKADTADAEEEAEEETTPETATANIMLIVPSRIEEGVECSMRLDVTPETDYNIVIVDKKTNRETLSEKKTSEKSSENIISTQFTIGKDKLTAGEYEVRVWTGLGTYEAAKSAGTAYQYDMSVCKSILAANNKYMSEMQVDSAEYVGKGKEVFPVITLVETKDGIEYQLKQDTDFKVTVISDNKSKMGAAKAKVEGIGQYAGAKEVDFDIAPKKSVFTGAVCNSTTNVKLTWGKSEDASGYVIDRKEEKGEYKNIAKVTDDTAYTDQSTDLSVGEIYTYRIRAYAASELDAAKEVTSAPSEISVKIIPGTPKLESIATVNTKKQKLTWKKVDDADGYTVYKVEKGKEIKAKDVNSAATSASIGKLSTGIKYTYCVKAFKKNAKGEKIYGNASNTMKAKVTVGTPKLVSVTSVKATENLIKWKKTKDAYGYYVFRRDASSSDSKFKKIGTVKSGTTVSYSDKSASTGKTYVYTVKAYTKAKVNGKKKTIAGAYDTKGISGKAIPAKTVFTLQENQKGVLITIANSEGATGYYLYRKKGDDKWMKRDVPAQAGDVTVYLDKDMTAKTSYQYYVVPYAKTGTQIVTGEPSDTIKFQTK